MVTMYNIKLNHEDFILLLSILEKARIDGITKWNPAEFVCEHTKVTTEDE